jgi:hypothetical protein
MTMTLHYQGKYSGDPADLPQRKHPPGAVRFREPETPEALGHAALRFATAAFLMALALFIIGGGLRGHAFGWNLITGVMLSVVAAIPHEFLHALCFREDVYIYTNLQQGMLFVVGTEEMSRRRFVFMSLLPNLVFGLVPLMLPIILPPILGLVSGTTDSGLTWLHVLAAMGLIALPMGAGDYLNIYNALTQVPRGAKVYLSGFHSYWYQP